MIAGIALITPAISHAQEGWIERIGVSVAEMRDVFRVGAPNAQSLVRRCEDERVGSIDDIIIAPDKAVSYAIVGASGFLGDKHDVAILVSKLKLGVPEARTSSQRHHGIASNLHLLSRFDRRG